MPTGSRRRWLWVAAAGLALVALGVGGWAFLARKQAPAPAAPEVPKVAASAGVLIGRSAKGRSVEAYTYGSGATKLLLVGGIHGGYEWNSVVLAYGVMDYLAANPTAIPASVSVTVVPNANPDGVFAVVGKEGRFAAADVPAGVDQSIGRFNGDAVDLNRNFDCNWQPKSTWRSKEVSGGTAAFSEPEAAAIRDLVATIKPVAVVFWHSQANGVYASQCGAGILPGTLNLMGTYASASGYPAIKTFDAYAVTGAAEDWLAKIGIPAVTVELSSHDAVELDRNLAGVKALIARYALAPKAQ